MRHAKLQAYAWVLLPAIVWCICYWTYYSKVHFELVNSSDYCDVDIAVKNRPIITTVSHESNNEHQEYMRSNKNLIDVRARFVAAVEAGLYIYALSSLYLFL